MSSNAAVTRKPAYVAPTVLVVDPNGTIAARVDRRAYTVVAVKTGGEALAAIAARSFDVLLLDMKALEGGLEALDAIARLAPKLSRQVVLVTSRHARRDHDALEAFEGRVLIKPFGVQDLEAAIDDVLVAAHVEGDPADLSRSGVWSSTARRGAAREAL